MNSKNKFRGLLLIAIMICACSPALYMPTMTDASRTGISADSLMMGRTLYTNHCGSCHNLHLPEQYTRAQWEKVMPIMKRKAKITDQEAQLITNFILARSKAE
ncbi:MAG TPA: hypothetical protein VGK10_09250 [Prolixibacteraceae bacterium]|jgi:cytochrome c5